MIIILFIIKHNLDYKIYMQPIFKRDIFALLIKLKCYYILLKIKAQYNFVPLFFNYELFYFITNIGVLAWKIIFLAMLGLNNRANIFRL